MRKGLWEKVSSRRHKISKIFPFGSGADEAMLHGTVDYGLKDGRQNSVDWAAHAHLVKEGDVVKMDFYQVYLVSSSQMLSSFETQSFVFSSPKKKNVFDQRFQNPSKLPVA